MKNEASLQARSRNQDLFVYQTLGEQNYRKDPEWLAWWYRLTTPPPLAPGATFRERDVERRARIASALSLYYAAALALAALVAAVGPNKQIFNIIIPSLVFISIGMVYNRFGKVNWAGWLLTIGIVGSMYWSLWTAPGGLSLTDTQILFLLIISDMFFVSILPLQLGWIPPVVNIAFSIIVLKFAHHSPALTALLPVSFFPTIFRLCMVHLVASGIPWILVAIMRRLIEQSHNAQEIVKLQRTMQHQTNVQLQEKEELEKSIQQIMTVLLRISNGDLTARVHAEDAPYLASIVGLLNNLLGRYEHTKKEGKEWEKQLLQSHQQRMEAQYTVRRMQAAMSPISTAIDHAIRRSTPFHCEKTSTPLDNYIIQELNGVYILPPQNREGRM